MHAIKALGTVVESLLGVLGFRAGRVVGRGDRAGRRVGCVMRLDLRDAALPDAPDRLADFSCATCRRCGGGRRVRRRRGVRDVRRQFRDQARDLSAALERRGAQLFDAVVVDRIEAGGRWRCVDNCGVAGVLDDPATRRRLLLRWRRGTGCTGPARN